MKLADYVAQYLVDQGVKKVFLMIGGACAHLVDSLGRNKDISYVCIQHEQAAAMAADAYARITKNLGVAMATSGPGATNLITGVCCSYFDSIPTLIITGQVNLWETKGKKSVRQLGFQETDIIDIIRPITKFAVLVKDPNKIKYYLEKAVYLAKSGRPGPVWLDIPMNVQHAEIDPAVLESFNSQEQKPEAPFFSADCLAPIIHKLGQAKRPAIIVGAGIKLGQAENQLFSLLEQWPVPVVSSWSGLDIVPYNHPLYIGQIGVYGSRAANFTVQNSDFLLSLGSRLDTRQTGGQPQTFAREAIKVVVDISEAELKKNWVTADLPVQANVKDFLTAFLEVLPREKRPDCSEWLLTCLKWKRRYPAVLPEYHRQKGSVNAYVFIEALSDKLPENSTVITDNGGVSVWTMQGFKVKKGQRLFSAFGHAPMGYALPAAIGAHFADPQSLVVCLIGDGGLQLSIQELQTVKNYQLPLKIFVMNNQAYGIIKQFQEIYFEARYEATVKQTGYTTPDFVKVAQAYGWATETIDDHAEIDEKLNRVLAAKEPILCNVTLDESQKLIPKLIAVKTADGRRYLSKPLEDMAPLLPRDEFRANMIVPPLEEEQSEKPSEIN